MEGKELRTGIRLSELIEKGTTFTLDTLHDDEDNESGGEDDFLQYPEVESFKLPFDKTFAELRNAMNEVVPLVWKKTYQSPQKPDAPTVDFSRHRVTYHRNFYLENDAYPFDSTWLNSKPHVICYNVDECLEGLYDALSTMQEGEKAYFVISYKKMFKELGCPPRVLPHADILCDLFLMKIEEIGREDVVQELSNESGILKSFEETKALVKEGRLKAKDEVNHEEYKSAISIYKQIIHALALCLTTSDAEQAELKVIKVEVLVNLATCYNLQEKPKQTLSTISMIEEICDISNNPKILFAKGKALRLDGDYTGAQRVMTKAYELRPKNKDVIDELMKLSAAVEKYKPLSWNIHV